MTYDFSLNETSQEQEGYLRRLMKQLGIQCELTNDSSGNRVMRFADEAMKKLHNTFPLHRLDPVRTNPRSSFTQNRPTYG